MIDRSLGHITLARWSSELKAATDHRRACKSAAIRNLANGQGIEPCTRSFGDSTATLRPVRIARQLNTPRL